MAARRVFTYRPPGGKTVSVALDLGGDCRIERVVFTGDFFVYPEHALEELEEELRGCSSAECIEAAFRRVEEEGATAVGFTWGGLAARLVEEWRRACEAVAGTRR